MVPNAGEIIAKIPMFTGKSWQLESLPGGLTNWNYRVTSGEESYVLRIGGPNVSLLGIDRKREISALTAAANAGIAPEVFWSDTASGILVSRFLEADGDLSPPHQPGTILEIAAVLKNVHRLSPEGAPFSPLGTIESYVAVSRERGFLFPNGFQRLVARCREYTLDLAQDQGEPRFCHNDLNGGNLFYAGRLRILDWEYAGWGDPFFDLASIALNFAYGPGRIDQLLAAYFGALDQRARQRIRMHMFLVRMFGLSWDMVQHCTLEHGETYRERITKRLEQAISEC
ncbi:MAG: choline/ethanolamine kinase family protein [Acidobacteriota bacterium]|nr:choline/ethanolamine kinase family protein [Acidobacteriota bacterium]